MILLCKTQWKKMCVCFVYHYVIAKRNNGGINQAKIEAKIPRSNKHT